MIKNYKIGIIITGNVRKSIQYNNLHNIINNLKENNYIDIYGLANKKYEHNSITWHNKKELNLTEINVQINDIHPSFINFKKIQIDDDQNFININKLWGV